MRTTEDNKYSASLRRTYIRLGAISIWFIVMSFAAYGGLLIHAFIGFAALTTLTYLTIKQANARAKYFEKKRIKQLSNYHLGEEYMNVFKSPEKKS